MVLGAVGAPAPAAPAHRRRSAAPRTAPAASAPARDQRRDGVLLLDADPRARDAAAAAAGRHLRWAGPQRALADVADGPEEVARTLGTARVAVLGSPRAGDVDSALQACTDAGVPLLLPAR